MEPDEVTNREWYVAESIGGIKAEVTSLRSELCLLRAAMTEELKDIKKMIGPMKKKMWIGTGVGIAAVFIVQFLILPILVRHWGGQ